MKKAPFLLVVCVLVVSIVAAIITAITNIHLIIKDAQKASGDQLLSVLNIDADEQVRLSDYLGYQLERVEIHRAPLDITIAENRRAYNKTNIDDNLSVIVVTDPNGTEHFYWYSKEVQLYDTNDRIIDYACMQGDCYICRKGEWKYLIEEIGSDE